MTLLYVTLAVLIGFVLAFFLGSLICFFIVFYSANNKKEEEYPIPVGNIYEEYREDLVDFIKQTRKLQSTDVSIRSHDGLTLRGKFFEYEKGAPIEILMHGYRGSSLRDLSGGVVRCHVLGHSALIVDHRGAGDSEGHVISFGINERYDCLRWVDFVLREIDPEADIILTGISMGAATVMMCASMELPDNVIGILADCGYTSAEEIITKVMRDLHLPPKLMYPMVKAGARFFGRFDPDSASPISSMAKSKVPVIFFHGDTDDFVPHTMSQRNFDTCISEKRLVIVKGAGHGLAFPVNRERYLTAMHEFFDPKVKAKASHQVSGT